MKLFRILPLIIGSVAAGILASTLPAHALDFKFNFTGVDNNTVEGTIYGLQDNGTSSASDITIDSTSNPAQLYRGSIYSPSNNSFFSTNANSFTVANGILTSASFSFTSDQVYLQLNNDLAGFGSDNFFQNNNAPTFGPSGFSGATYSSADVPFDIPGGATIPAVGGLLALGLMRKARKRIASKTRIANPVCASVS